MKNMRVMNNQLVGNVGLYYCCYKLTRMGWNVMPTARNARGVDLIAYNEDASKIVSVQVKALSKRNPVPLGTSLDKLIGDFWIIVTKTGFDDHVTYVMLPSEIKAAAHKGESDGRVSFWLQPTRYDQPEFRDAWHRIGHGGLDDMLRDGSRLPM